MQKKRHSKIKIILSVAMCTFLIACSATKEPLTDEQQALKEKNEAVLAESGYKCKKVKLTGTRIPTKVCETQQQRETRQQDAQKMVADVVNGAPPPQSE
ncbi:hypothetical protein [Shewanella sp. OMA3-2]|uniref:hypothetical protein n=1 Tax=Shewanella sp. OMA3-2 TaxID=2908650 RepID=UPI001F1BDA60|nr:hypothetical protein [Shewanella sp. OMA3-2]UJF22153.1 hypothetical protein L0B17_01495 [Shewanella sp. OMA3-2]